MSPSPAAESSASQIAWMTRRRRCGRRGPARRASRRRRARAARSRRSACTSMPSPVRRPGCSMPSTFSARRRSHGVVILNARASPSTIEHGAAGRLEQRGVVGVFLSPRRRRPRRGRPAGSPAASARARRSCGRRSRRPSRRRSMRLMVSLTGSAGMTPPPSARRCAPRAITAVEQAAGRQGRAASCTSTTSTSGSSDGEAGGDRRLPRLAAGDDGEVSGCRPGRARSDRLGCGELGLRRDDDDLRGLDGVEHAVQGVLEDRDAARRRRTPSGSALAEPRAAARGDDDDGDCRAWSS